MFKPGLVCNCMNACVRACMCVRCVCMIRSCIGVHMSYVCARACTWADGRVCCLHAVCTSTRGCACVLYMVLCVPAPRAATASVHAPAHSLHQVALALLLLPRCMGPHDLGLELQSAKGECQGVCEQARADPASSSPPVLGLCAAAHEAPRAPAECYSKQNNSKTVHALACAAHSCPSTRSSLLKVCGSRGHTAFSLHPGRRRGGC